jgi:hypothetical protein
MCNSDERHKNCACSFCGKLSEGTVLEGQCLNGNWVVVKLFGLSWLRLMQSEFGLNWLMVRSGGCLCWTFGFYR